MGWSKTCPLLSQVRKPGRTDFLDVLDCPSDQDHREFVAVLHRSHGTGCYEVERCDGI